MILQKRLSSRLLLALVAFLAFPGMTFRVYGQERSPHQPVHVSEDWSTSTLSFPNPGHSLRQIRRDPS